MSVGQFQRRLHGARYAGNDLKYFPLWVRRYAESVTAENGRLPVSVDLVKGFSRSLLQSGIPAWQRSHLVGLIDPNEPTCLQEMRREMRLRRKALETERAYAGWVSRFMRHCGSDDLRQFGEREIKSFLTQLAVEGNVAPNTQNQAKSALLFLYQQVFHRELAILDAVSADKPKRLPVVLSREEIARVWPQFKGLRRLMFQVMYGAGLRHRECRRLRIKDICLDEGHIVVRTGKGAQDRITVLPERNREALVQQIEAVRRLHQEDLAQGSGAV